MTYGQDYLDEILEELKDGRRQWRRGDKLLDAFGYTRRRQSAIDLINYELQQRGMTTNPPLSTSMPLDRGISFFLANGSGEAGISVAGVSAPGTGASTEPSGALMVEAPPVADVAQAGGRSLVVGNLEAAERVPLQIDPGASISAAMTLMDLHDYSQLPVTTGSRSIKGLVSFKSIARAQLHGTCITVADGMDVTVPVVERTESLLRVIGLLGEHDAVLVRDQERRLGGIVTAADISLEFENLAGPFLLIGQIEDQLRWLVRELDLSAALAMSGAVVERSDVDVADLTMGNLHRILENPENWTRVGIAYDRDAFCHELNAVRDIRNAVMHFREPSAPDVIRRLQKFASVVQRAYVANMAQRPALHDIT